MKGSNIRWLALVVLLAACGGAEPAAETAADAPPATLEPSSTGSALTHDNLLTAEDVAGVSGFEGVHLVPRNPQVGAGGDLNFAREGEQLVLLANIQNAEFFEQIRSRTAGPVSGIGDEALEGPDRGPRHMLVFRKGDRAVALSSFFDMTGQPLLTQDQLRQLAALMESRM
jgi:hypothetical protein